MGAEFHAQVKAFAIKAKKLESAVFHDICLSIAVRAANYTPVLTGYARGNWQVSWGSPKTDEIARFWKNAVSKRDFSPALRGRRPEQPVFIRNNVRYIEFVEWGCRSRRAHMMLHRAVAEEKDMLHSTIRRAISSGGEMGGEEIPGL